MKRSNINKLLGNAAALLAEHRCYLPPFASWTVADWQRRSDTVREIVNRRLGWDVTDYGLGRFEEEGLILFTLRNGSIEDLNAGRGEVYAEKIMIVGVDQLAPMHFHWRKTEDIINRGGGRLVIRLFNPTDDDGLAETDVEARVDGIWQRLPAGGSLILHPGESITIPPRLYHAFWAEGETVLAGEVSTVNDDERDNRFHEPIARFSMIEEDVPPLRLLVSDYAEYVTA